MIFAQLMHSHVALYQAALFSSLLHLPHAWWIDNYNKGFQKALSKLPRSNMASGSLTKWPKVLFFFASFLNSTYLIKNIPLKSCSSKKKSFKSKEVQDTADNTLDTQQGTCSLPFPHSRACSLLPLFYCIPNTTIFKAFSWGTTGAQSSGRKHL